jgi:signal transduction histidine kinase
MRGVFMRDAPTTGAPSNERTEAATFRRATARYVVAVGLALGAFGATFLLKHVWTGPGSTALIPVVQIAAFFVLASTIAATIIALQRANCQAESRATELERIAARATKLMEVTAALSEASSVEEVTAVVLGKGVAAVEAARGLLVSAEGERVAIVGARGYSAEIEARVRVITRGDDVPLMEALRTGAAIWLTSAREYESRFGWAFERFGAVSETQAHVATPLIHLGETVGGLSLTFEGPSAFGAADRAFTLLLAQATAAALHRAYSYDAEREKRRHAETLAHAREDVLAAVAHDLRNPLGLIGATAQLLLEATPPDAERTKLLDGTVRAVKQMNRLIADLLDAVRLQAGRLSLDREDILVSAILRQAEESFRRLADSRHIQFAIERSDDGIAVRADPVRVSQVLGNLLGNALKFTPEGGAVTLRAVRAENRVDFEVVDTGPGIPSSDLPHLFDSFWQARANDRRGVGLGLAIAKGLVEAHGGTIAVTSVVGAGSTFVFSLPAVAESPTRRRQHAPLGSRARDARTDRMSPVLLADAAPSP